MPFFQTRDGTRLFYRQWGTGEPVIFIHGFTLSSDFWEYQLAFVAREGLCAIASDRRGHGRSDDPGAGYDYDTLADDLAALLERLDVHHATLVGHSMGAGELNSTSDFRRELGAFTIPTLIIQADGDRNNPVDLTGRRTAQAIPGSQLKVYEGTDGHAVFVTHKERFNADLLGFVRGEHPVGPAGLMLEPHVLNPVPVGGGR